MNDESAVLTLLQDLKSDGFRFSNYQELPKFALNYLARAGVDIDYQKDQLSLDDARFAFLAEYWPAQPGRVAEIGSNIGYFCLRLAYEFRCIATGYEPISSYSRASSAIAELCELSDYCQFQADPINLKDIAKLEEVDLLIELNVLHHAGTVFDVDEVIALGSWRSYAVERLAQLKKRSEVLFFQTGNTSAGDALFPTEDAAVYMADILTEAGWRIVSVGAITDLTNFHYQSWSSENISDVQTYRCHRDSTTNLVKYYKSEKLAGALSTGLANRPIWICQR